MIATYEEALRNLEAAVEEHADLRKTDLALVNVGTLRDALRALDEVMYERRGLRRDIAEADAEVNAMRDQMSHLEDALSQAEARAEAAEHDLAFL